MNKMNKTVVMKLCGDNTVTHTNYEVKQTCTQQHKLISFTIT